jgi:hypothetical protein
VRDYLRIGLVAYSGTDARNGFTGPLAAENLPPLSRVAEAPLRIESRIRRADRTSFRKRAASAAPGSLSIVIVHPQARLQSMQIAEEAFVSAACGTIFTAKLVKVSKQCPEVLRQASAEAAGRKAR